MFKTVGGTVLNRNQYKVATKGMKPIAVMGAGEPVKHRPARAIRQAGKAAKNPQGVKRPCGFLMK
jgi:hypothetical protein